MYKHILLCLSLLFILGCSAKKEASYTKDVSKDEMYHSSLVNTQKAQLMGSLETKALLTATYLNPIFTERKSKKEFNEPMHDGEYFFVGVYITDSEEQQFNTQGYSLTLNGLEPIEVVKLEKGDPLHDIMPMVDNWSTYYKVKFEKSSKDNFSLIFENDRFGKDLLNYSKEEKPLFESLRGSSK
jgi:hypothetical protein